MPKRSSKHRETSRDSANCVSQHEHFLTKLGFFFSFKRVVAYPSKIDTFMCRIFEYEKACYSKHAIVGKLHLAKIARTRLNDVFLRPNSIGTSVYRLFAIFGKYIYSSYIHIQCIYK